MRKVDRYPTMAAPEAPAPAPPTPPPRRSAGTRLPDGLAAFRHRNYRLYFTGQLISVTGTWMQSLAQLWLVETLTASAFKLGLVGVFQSAPVLVLGLAGGVIADRFSKRTLVVITQSIMGVLGAIMAVLVWTDLIRLWQVYTLAFALGIVKSLDLPTRQAFVTEMVGTEDLLNAIALNSALFNAARIVGPAIAGVLLAAFGPAICFAIDAVSYVAVVVCLLMMRLKPHVRAISGRSLDQLREGLAYVREHPNVSRPIVLVGVAGAFGMNFNVWIALLAKKDLNAGAGGFGLLLSALGVGSLVGALALAFAGRRAHPGLMVLTSLILAISEILLAIAGAIPLSLAVAMVILAATGFAASVTTATANTVVQTDSPDDLRGRVMSVYMTVFAGSAPFGSLMAGSSAGLAGTPFSIALGAAGTLAVSLWLLITGRRETPAPGEARKHAAGVPAALSSAQAKDARRLAPTPHAED